MAADADGQPLAFVFKTIADPYVGQLSLFKVLSGTIKPDDHLVNPRTGADERLHGLFALRGKEQDPVTSVAAGDIAAVAKLSAHRAPATRWRPKGTPVRVAGDRAAAAGARASPSGPRTQADDDKLGAALAPPAGRGPGARASSATTRRTRRCCGASARPTCTIALERLDRKFGVNVDTDDVRVPYRETITRQAEAEGKYKKQTGGHGQFGVAWLRVEPLDRGDGLRVRRHDRRRRHPAAVHPRGAEGHRGDDGRRRRATASRSSTCRSTCFDGKYHSVDSSEMSFKMAGSLGFKEAMAKAGAVVLEPVSLLEVTVPAAYQGDVMGDINARRGRVQGTDAVGDGEQEVIALVPTSEIMRYADRPALDDRRPRPLHRRRTTTTTSCRRTSSTSFRSRRPKRTERPLPRRRGGRGALVRASSQGGDRGRASCGRALAVGDPRPRVSRRHGARRHHASPRRVGRFPRGW